jgi:hypothetical protein
MADTPTPGNTSAGNITPKAGPPPAAKQVAPIARAVVKREDLLSLQQLDPSSMDPNRHYRWVRTVLRDDDQSLSVRQKQLIGYTIEQKKPDGVKTMVESDSTSDGSIRMGDLVLMSCPKALRQERETEALHFNEKRLGANSETYRARVKGQRGAKLVGEESEERE